MFVMATWGLNIVSIKYLTQHMDIQALAAVRIVVAFITVTLIIKARRGRIPKLGRVELGWVALAGFLVCTRTRWRWCRGCGFRLRPTAR